MCRGFGFGFGDPVSNDPRAHTKSFLNGFRRDDPERRLRRSIAGKRISAIFHYLARWLWLLLSVHASLSRARHEKRAHQTARRPESTRLACAQATPKGTA